MDRVIKADLYRYGRLTGFKGFIKGWMDPGFRYTFFFRKVSRNKKLNLSGIFFRLLKRRYSYKYGYQINNDAQIGEGFYIFHRGTIIIGPVKIGSNCTVSHNVIIGRSYKDGKIGRPTIGDKVWIGSGAHIVGDIKIGSNVMVAPNSLVNFDVPDNSIVISNKCNIIRKDDPTKYYITDILGE